MGETEFAHDATFGYSSSRLTEWVEEKTQGDVAATDVLCIKLRTIRSTSNDIAAELLHAAHRQPIVVDIVDEYDLRALALGILQAERMGKRFIYRVGPPFVRARIGQKPPRCSVQKQSQPRVISPPPWRAGSSWSVHMFLLPRGNSITC
nr:four-carbon acid sugar kinase family protein [Corynebacterium pseudotuberculosis]